MKKIITIFLIIVLSLFAVGCENKRSETTDNIDIKMKIGDTTNLSSYCTESEFEKTIKWSSNNKTVANVNSKGVVEASDSGYATITAIDEEGKTMEFNISVAGITIENILLNKGQIKLAVNKSTQIKATIKPDNATIKDLTWSSSDEEVAVVNSTGLVTGINPGTINISCTSSNGKEASCTVTVYDNTTETTAEETTTEEIVEIEEGYGDFGNGFPVETNYHNSFYGVWVGAKKTMDEAEKFAQELVNNGFEANIFVSTDWSNLNSEPWYVITSGVYDSKSEADYNLDMVKEVYPNAYIKASGYWKG